MISSFSGAFAFLSNFYPSSLRYEGISYPTVEHAFQAAKVLDARERLNIVGAPTPAKAKQLGRRVKLRPDWEEVKIPIMFELVLQKFTVHDHLRKLLEATHPHELIEVNYWHDTFWGVCGGVGENNLGKILMKVRDM